MRLGIFGQNYALHFVQNFVYFFLALHSSPITQPLYITFCLFLFVLHPIMFKKLLLLLLLLLFSFVSFHISLV